MEFRTILDNRLAKGVRVNMLPALNFAAELYDSTTRIRDLPRGEKIGLSDKIMCVGYAEHDWLRGALKGAELVETRLTPLHGYEGGVMIEICIFRSTGDAPCLKIFAHLLDSQNEIKVARIEIK